VYLDLAAIAEFGQHQDQITQIDERIGEDIFLTDDLAATM
jgi:hypothetical protein